VTAREPDTMDDMDHTDPAAGEPPEKRIGDRERREVDARLREAHDDGVLTLGEYDERAARCWAARTGSDLDALTRDLPDPAPVEPTADPAAPEPALPAGDERLTRLRESLRDSERLRVPEVLRRNPDGAGRRSR